LASLVPGETLRILLVSTREELRATIGEALAGRVGDHRLFYVSQPDLALGRASDVIPHVILIDDDLGGVTGGTLIGQLVQRAPRAAILAIVGENALGRARAAVLAGARAFITQPINPDDLVAALRQVLAAARGASLAADNTLQVAGKIITFCAPKGGTGRTTLAANVAISLFQARKQPVVLVDADYAAPALDVALNVDPSRNIVDLLPKLNRLDPDLIHSVLTSHTSGIRVLLAPLPADLAHPISLPQVQQVLAWLKRMFPWVVVDLGLPLDETAFAFLDSADRIVMSVLPEMVGLRNTRLMLDQLRERGYADEKIWLVLNRADLRGGVPSADIEDRLKLRIRYKLPDDQALATHAVNRGVPLVLSHRGSGLARAVHGLTLQLAEDLAPDEEAGREASGLFGRLFGKTPVTGA
jgi:pilus assembly protein CpaE